VNPYDVLGVPRDADDDAIRKAFRKAARKYHPDLNKSPGAEARFKAVNTANEILSDPARRRAYDEFGEASTQAGFDPNAARAFRGGGRGFQGSFNGGGVDLGDLLGSMFGARGGRVRPQHAPDSEIALTVDLLDALRGAERELTVRDGSGATSTVRVPIPAGARDGGKVRLRGRAPGGGDLVVHLHVAEHAVLRRIGDDLELDVPVTVAEALRGAAIVVPTHDGDVRVTVPAGSKAGARLRLRGRGPKRGDGAGDLFLVLRVAVPETADAAALAAAEALEPAYGDVRSALRRAL
jgi:DnaJ-class molecular chaperone